MLLFIQVRTGALVHSTCNLSLFQLLSGPHSSSAHEQNVHLAVTTGHRIEAVQQVQGAEDLPFFCHFPLDRKAEWRRDAAKLSQLLADKTTHLLPLFGDKVLVHR